MYPFEVRHWIDQRGGLSSHVFFLSGHELAAMYRPCRIDPHVSSHWKALSSCACWQSAIAGKPFSNFIKPLIEHVKSNMKALVVKVEYVADQDETEKPMVTIQVAENLVGRPANEDSEFP